MPDPCGTGIEVGVMLVITVSPELVQSGFILAMSHDFKAMRVVAGTVCVTSTDSGEEKGMSSRFSEDGVATAVAKERCMYSLHSSARCILDLWFIQYMGWR